METKMKLNDIFQLHACTDMYPTSEYTSNTGIYKFDETGFDIFYKCCTIVARTMLFLFERWSVFVVHSLSSFGSETWNITHRHIANILASFIRQQNQQPKFGKIAAYSLRVH